MTPSERRAARAGWHVRLVRGMSTEAEQDEDTIFELAIPPAERAAMTWELSRELFELAARNGKLEEAFHERRLPRSAYRLERR